MNRAEVARSVARRVQLAYAGSEILDAAKVAAELVAAGNIRGITAEEIIEMVLAEAAKYGGSATTFETPAKR